MRFYANIGRRIKELAIVQAALGMVAGVIAGIILLIWHMIGLGIGILLGGPVASVFLSWLIYGFGELVEKVAVIARINAIKFVKEIDDKDFEYTAELESIRNTAVEEIKSKKL